MNRFITRAVLMQLFLLLCAASTFGQGKTGPDWTTDGNGYYDVQDGSIVLVSLPKMERKVVVSGAVLRQAGVASGISRSFSFSTDGTKALIFTNTKRVWRYNTRGDYYVVDLKTNVVQQVGKDKPTSS